MVREVDPKATTRAGRFLENLQREIQRLRRAGLHGTLHIQIKQTVQIRVAPKEHSFGANFVILPPRA